MRRLALLLAASVLAPRLAAAQEAAPTLQEDPRAAKFRDVERGFFVGFEAGYLGLLDTPVADKGTYPFAGNSGGASGGMLVGVHLGVELGRFAAVSVFALGGTQKADPSYGAFSVFAGGGDVRATVWTKKDLNGYPRFTTYVHGRAGYAITYPKGLFGDNDVFIGAGPGIEYFTRLRHFSIGVAADYVHWLDAGANGYAVYPTVRYTF